MKAAVVNLEIPQGATFRHGFIYKNVQKRPVDLTGLGAHMQIRSSSGVLIADLSTDNGGIVLGDETGAIDLFIEDEVTRAMSFVKALYDLHLVVPKPEGKEDRLRILKGEVTLSIGQTKP